MRSGLAVAVLLSVVSIGCGGGVSAGGASRDGIRVEPATLSLGAIRAGATGEAEVTLRAEGRGPIRVRRIALESDTPGVELLLAPETVSADGASLRVRYRPTGPGPLAGSVIVELDSRDTPRLAIPLEGGSPGPALTCEPQVVDFGEVAVGVSAERTVTCTNTGWAGDGVAYVTLVGAGPDSPEFEVELPTRDVGVGDHVEVGLRYRPADVHETAAAVDLSTDPPALAPPLRVHGAGISLPCELALGQPAVPTEPPGATAMTTVVVRNVGAASCWIGGVALAEPCEAFSVQGRHDPGWLEPDGIEELRFLYHPSGPGTDTCRVVLDTRPAVELTLTGECAYRGCLGYPEEIQFVPSVWTCPRERVLPVENRCSVPVPVSIALAGEAPNAFALGAVPAEIPPGGADVEVIFTPPAGGTFRDRLVIVDPEGRASVALSGDGTSPAGRVFAASLDITREPPDAVVVIDNGVMMGGFAGQVRSQLGGLFEALEAGNLPWSPADHRLAVTTTGLVPDPACPGLVQGGEDGRFVPVDHLRARSVDRTTPNRRSVVEANLAVGACHHAAAQPLEAALRALIPPLSTLYDDYRHPEADDGNMGLLDASSSRFLVLVSNRDDASPLPVAEYVTRLAEAGVEEVLVIAGDPGTGCTRQPIAAVAGDRLAAFAAAFPRSRWVSICDPTWPAQTLPPLLEDHCFPGCVPDTNLDGRIDDADVQVRLNGVPLLAADGAWSRDETSHQLCLHGGVAARWGSNELWVGFPMP